MSLEVLTPRELLGVYRDDRLASPSNYFRNLGGFNTNTFFSDKQTIVFEKVDSDRKIAPFVHPNSTGRPTYKRRGSTAQAFAPAYIKPKDPVVPSEQFTRRPGNLFDDAPRSPAENWDNEVAAIMEHHRTTIDRRWEWMCAEAMLYGGVNVEYLDGPTAYVDYGRDPTLTEIKTANYWDETFDILRDIQEYTERMARAPFGGIAARLTVGREVWPRMQKNEGLLQRMDNTMKNSTVNLPRGLTTPTTPDSPFVFLGTIDTLEVWLYNDFYEDDAGNQVDFMNPRDILLTAGNVGGVMAFGAILDADAGLQPMAVFPKMWKENDPSAAVIMTQSAPLPILVNPNRTFRARVVEEDSNSGG